MKQPNSPQQASVNIPAKTVNMPESFHARRGFLQFFTAAVLSGALFNELCAMAEDEVKRPLTVEEKDHLKKVEELINEKWEVQNEMYGEIATVGFQEYYESRPDKEKAFFTPEQIAAGLGACECCSDEGNRHYRNKETDCDMLLKRVPGSGILRAFDREDQNPFADDFITEIAQECIDDGVTVFTGHHLCGAFKEVYNNWLKKQGMPPAKQAELDKKCQEWTELVVKRMKELAPEKADSIKADFIEKLDRPEEIHVARCLYLTDLDEFNAGYDGLPQGFVERTGKKDDLSKVLNHADILRKIAFDKAHAFGGKFSTKASEQFVICCVTDDPKRLKILIEKAKATVAGLDKDAQKKIRVEGLLQTAA
jgi:hypothetical protein